MARPPLRTATLAALAAALVAFGACAPDPGAEPVGVGSAASPMDIVSRSMPHSTPVSAGRVVIVGSSSEGGRSQPVIIRETDAAGNMGGVARPIEARGGERY